MTDQELLEEIRKSLKRLEELKEVATQNRKYRAKLSIIMAMIELLEAQKILERHLQD